MTDVLVPRSVNQRMALIERVHFVGIGGVGMSGIAEVLLNLGYRVSGSDIRPSQTTKRLQALGAKIFIGHRREHVAGADVVVVSSAVDQSNPEVQLAREQRLPVVPRAEMLAELMRFRYGIAVAGTHGKTTTTSLVASILGEADCDPTFVIGGRLNSIGSNARLGSSQYLVAEADESDASFLHLQPMISVVTNIDADHLDTYEGDFSRLRETFLEFLHHLPFYGLAVLCIDDQEVRALSAELMRPLLTYGFSADADLRAVGYRVDGLRSCFEVVGERLSRPLEVCLNLPGRHNALNALAAIAVALELQLPLPAVSKALQEFQGIGRRFQVCERRLDDGRSYTLVDDYGHHPKEVEATLAAARASWPDRRLLLAFQPHRYSRTRDQLDDFARVLSQVDLLVLTEVYPAGEEPIVGADGRSLSRAIRVRGQVDPVFVEDPSELPEVLNATLQDGDLVIMMGAGNIGQIAAALAGR